MTLVAILALAVIGSTAMAAGHKKPKVTESDDVMVLEYDFAEPQVSTDGYYDVVTVDGLERYNKTGEPVIPVKPVQILVPAGMEIEKITSQAMDTYQLTGTYLLEHGAKQFRKDFGPPKTPALPDPEIFSMAAFWPAQQHELVTVQTNRGYKIAHIILFPLQYAPKDGKIKMAAKMRLKVSLTGTDAP